METVSALFVSGSEAKLLEVLFARIPKSGYSAAL
jgi:hypothetical protein